MSQSEATANNRIVSLVLVNEADGTVFTGTLNRADILIRKFGSADYAALNTTTGTVSQSAVATSRGTYLLGLEAADLDTRGPMEISTKVSGVQVHGGLVNVLHPGSFNAKYLGAAVDVGNVTGNVAGNVSGSVASVTNPVDVGSNSDKSGYVLDTSANNASVDFSFRKNVAYAGFAFPMFDGVGDLVTGLTVSGVVVIDGATPAALGTVTEVGSGWYKVDLTAANMNGDQLGLAFTATGAKPTVFNIATYA
ncbi:MAG: hypothetical protein R3330_03425 [Saprospiraceae bacterium]|nr:hypothetical protein [Saprospiraceae bacterium]